MNNEIKPVGNDFEVVPLDDPGFLEAQKRRAALDSLAEYGEEMEKHRILEEARIDKWWNELSYDERCDAFYAVMKRLHKGEIEDRGSYRYVLYDVFGFGPEMYARGMDCGYIVLHNRIIDEEDQRTLWDLKRNV
jgi:hypothetical protein